MDRSAEAGCAPGAHVREGAGGADRPRVSILVPVLDDAAALERLLGWLLAVADERVEILVIDGGSADASRDVARSAGVDDLLEGARGRGAQLALGAERARGTWLWMLHADSEPEPACLAHLLERDDRPGWGRFAVRLSGSALLPVVAWSMNVRSCLTGICTGDQGIFVHRQWLGFIGGMPSQPLMEDIELSRRLKRLARPVCRTESIRTSSRRWLKRGVGRTILGMWWFRLRYWAGADPQRLAREYYR
jgi:rSAM/selenodomain-associated transferase 2